MTGTPAGPSTTTPDHVIPLTLHRHPRLLACAPPLAAATALVGIAAIGGVTASVATALALAAAAAAVDARTGSVPDALVVATAVPVVAAGVLGGSPGQVATGAALFAAPLFVVHVIAPGAMGFGDVKLALALGAGVGLFEPLLSVVALAVAAAGAVAFGIARSRSEAPFAPALVVGTACAVLAHGPLTAALTGGAPS